VNPSAAGDPLGTSPVDTVLLIHGLWMNPRSWEHWIERYSAQGYKVLAPAWPGLEGEVEKVRRDASAVRGVGVKEVVDHYARVIAGLDRPPILMGHSFGGAFVQLLLDRGLGSAGVAIDSAQVKGVLPLPLSAVRAALPVLRSPANKGKAIGLTPEQFHYAFTNNLTAEDSRAVYDRYHVPGPARVLFQGAFANFNPRAATRVDFRNSTRAPLLFLAGGNDHTVPASVNKANARLYRKSSAVTDYHEFPGRSHFTAGEPGWEEVADFALSWAVGHAADHAA
jgi:alpha-beta hydrolase superfamily lysophospholipase